MFEILIHTAADCPEELFEFRYSIYVEEMHRKQRYADHGARTIIDPLDETARQVVAYKDGEIVGCIRANLLRDGPVGDYYDFYELGALSADKRADASICTRLMIRPEARHTRLSIALFLELYRFALSNEVSSSFIDCNPHLIGFFEKFGYEAMFKKEHPEYGMVTVMALDHYDFDRLVGIRSPFAPLARAKMKSQIERARVHLEQMTIPGE